MELYQAFCLCIVWGHIFSSLQWQFTAYHLVLKTVLHIFIFIAHTPHSWYQFRYISTIITIMPWNKQAHLISAAPNNTHLFSFMSFRVTWFCSTCPISFSSWDKSALLESVPKPCHVLFTEVQKYKRAKPTVQAHFKSPVNIWLVKASHVSPKPRSREIHSTFCGRNCSYVAKGVNIGKGWGLRPKIQSQPLLHLPYEWSSISGSKCRKGGGGGGGRAPIILSLGT